MWNSKALAAPPVCEQKVLLNPKKRVKLKKAYDAFKEASTDFEDHVNLLRMEQSVMRLAVYKFCNQFRSDKAVRGLRQILSCVKTLEHLQIPALVMEVKTLVNITGYEDEVYMTSRQTIQYYLVRLQGTSAFLSRMLSHAMRIFPLLQEQIQKGFMLSQNIVMVSGVARLWYISRFMRDKVCNLYSKLLECVDVFKPTEANWLQDELPENIETWLSQMFDMGLPEEQSRSMLEAAGIAAMGTGDTVTNVNVTSTPNTNLLLMEDVGEPISRKRPAQPSTTDVSPTKKQKTFVKAVKMESEENVSENLSTSAALDFNKNLTCQNSGENRANHDIGENLQSVGNNQNGVLSLQGCASTAGKPVENTGKNRKKKKKAKKEETNSQGCALTRKTVENIGKKNKKRKKAINGEPNLQGSVSWSGREIGEKNNYAKVEKQRKHVGNVLDQKVVGNDSKKAKKRKKHNKGKKQPPH